MDRVQFKDRLVTVPEIGLSRIVGGILLLLLVPAIAVRFHYLSNPLIEPHPYRQTMSALVTQFFAQHGVSFFHYRSPDNGLFWNVMHEFPIFQFLAVGLIHLGLSLEAASRLVTLAFFFGGAWFLHRILEILCDRSVAFWAVLCYGLSPYNIIYSRTGLIDFTAQFFMLGLIFATIRAIRDPEGPSVRRFVGMAFFSGVLAALVKCYLWFVPVTFIFLYCAREYWLRRNRPAFWIALGLLAQAAITVAWLVWTGHIRGEEWAKLVSPTWIFGTLDQRLHWQNWIPQFQWIARLVLHDWMVLPFALGVFWGRPRSLVLTCIAIILLPIVVLFNSSQHHDYYLMNQVPYIFSIVGLGWSHLFKRCSARVQWAGFIVMGALLVRGLLHIGGTLEPIYHDYRADLKEPLSLKEISAPEDRIYLEGFDERFDMPLYSERLARPYFRKSVVELEPTLFVFREEVRAEALSPFSEQWIDRESPYFRAVRVKSVPGHPFDPAHHIGLFAQSMERPLVLLEGGTRALNLCQSARDHEVIQIPRGNEVVITVGGRVSTLAGGRFLSLPTRAPSCEFLVRIENRI
ncbi:MAG: glycosyltransferase family 39 protein [Deltaproteobacteria bacterium]|nr:glycosyltransferase family 39 protein [Deltaproteobacteria bacterium]MBI3296305.1 glycosyltransferase family 39 protein [Deltaproteobacteria bacterium]